MRRPLSAGMSLFSALCLSASNALGDSQCDAVPDNIVGNCGFETGAFAPEWTCEPDSTDCRVNGHDVHSGFFAMESSNGCISQTLTTVPDQSYDLSYWIPSYAWGGEDFEWTVSWNHEVVTRWYFFELQSYTQYGVQGLIGTGADTLTFCGYIFNYYWYIDDIVVIPSPETSR